MNVFIKPYQLSNWVFYQIFKYLASLILICLLQGQAQMEGYEYKYLDAKLQAYLKENEASTDDIIPSPPKQW